MLTKYLGKTYDSLWKVISFDRKKSSYTLENIYNQTKLEISFKTLRKVDEGKTTISKVTHHNIKRGVDRRIEK